MSANSELLYRAQIRVHVGTGDMANRTQAIGRARYDTGAALACAREITEAWYRCQAIAWVARFAPHSELIGLAQESLQAASAGTDTYQKVAAAAWPVRALVERGEIETAEVAAHSLLPLARRIEHEGSRAEALILLFQAALPAPRSTWQPVLDAILAMPFSTIQWRHRRALSNAVLLVHGSDPESVRECLSRVQDEKARKQIEARIASSRRLAPRAFFLAKANPTG